MRKQQTYWKQQPGIDPEHVLSFGRKENFWEMADTGPCGPCCEIHIDRGAETCDKQDVPGHVCRVNGDCKRFLEIWNLVFIQYNRFGPTQLEPLPATHVDTGMGFERIVSLLQDVNSNYRTDLLWPLIEETQRLTGQTDEQVDAEFHPLPGDRRSQPGGRFPDRRWGGAGQHRAQLCLPHDHPPRGALWLARLA